RTRRPRERDPVGGRRPERALGAVRARRFARRRPCAPHRTVNGSGNNVGVGSLACVPQVADRADDRDPMSEQITVKLPDGSSREYASGAPPAEVAASIGKGLARAAIAAKADGEWVDLNR